MELFHQPHAFIQWVDGTEIDRSFDSEADRQHFVTDSIRNDPRIRSLRFYSRLAPRGLQ
jgi:hypothetical protein